MNLILLFLAGLILMILGAELLVRGATRVASSLGISQLVVGLTVVAFGTSAPEFAVSVKAALSGQTGVAVGNVIGSNIFNVLVILGLAAVISPLVVSAQLVKWDVPFMAACSGAALLLCLDLTLSRWEGFLLLALLLGYIVAQVRQCRMSSDPTDGGGSGEPVGPTITSRRVADVCFILGGLALLVIGSNWLCDSSNAIARRLGVSELALGLTIVAAATSLPEMITSIVATLRGKLDMAVGNVVGSNVFNLLGVLGAATVLAPDGIQIPASTMSLDFPFMVAVAIACLPVFFTDGIISRTEGAVFLGYYAAYTAYLLMAATQHDALPAFNAVMLLFVIPLTLATLVLITTREWRRKRKSHKPGAAKGNG